MEHVPCVQRTPIGGLARTKRRVALWERDTGKPSDGWFAVFGYFLTSSIALLIGLTLWLLAGIVITYREPKNAAKIIDALGHFPLRKR